MEVLLLPLCYLILQIYHGSIITNTVIKEYLPFLAFDSEH